MVSYKVITPDTVDHSKSQYSKFVITAVKENKPEFLNYSKTGQRLDEFMMKYVRASPTIVWSASSRAWIQCQQKSACGKSTHNSFNCSMYHPQSHGVS